MKTILATNLLATLPVYAAVASIDLNTFTAADLIAEVERVTDAVTFDFFESDNTTDFVPQFMADDAVEHPESFAAKVVQELLKTQPVGNNEEATFSKTDEAFDVSQVLLFRDIMGDAETTIEQDVLKLQGADTTEYFKAKEKLGGINPALFSLMLFGDVDVIILNLVSMGQSKVVDFTEQEVDRVLAAYKEAKLKKDPMIQLAIALTGQNPLDEQLEQVKTYALNA